MFDKSAIYYDLIYKGKDYEAETRRLLEMVPKGARSLLDVGCGTGEHHRFFHGLEVHGLDLNDEFLEVARAKNPAARYFQADMRDFSLGQEYDVVVSLFSAIGYCQTVEDLVAALMSMARHLAPSGVLLVEPWLTPDVWNPGRIYSDVVSRDGLHVCRMSHSRRAGHLSIMDFHYLVGENGKGVRNFQEQHVMGLYSRQEMESAFRQAGLEPSYDESGLTTGRGLYKARLT